MLWPSFEKQFNDYISWKTYLVIANAVFILSALLHLGLLFALPRYNKLQTESKCGCSPLIRKRVFKPHNEPYYMEIDIDPIEVNRLYDTLGKHSKSLKLESTFKDKLEELLDYLEDEL